MAIPESFQDFPLALKLKHQCSFLKKSKAPGNFHWCKLGFPVQISRWRLTKKISPSNLAELFSLECHGQACSQNLCFCYRRRQKQSPQLEPQGPGSVHKENADPCHPSRVATLSASARVSRAAGVWVRSQQRLECCTKALGCAQRQGNANLGQSRYLRGIYGTVAPNTCK